MSHKHACKYGNCREAGSRVIVTMQGKRARFCSELHAAASLLDWARVREGEPIARANLTLLHEPVRQYADALTRHPLVRPASVESAADLFERGRKLIKREPNAS